VEENLFIARDRISKSLIQKGYEPELVWKALKKLLPD
jgi:SOS response regulatory protein OraA/RecX